MEGCFFFLSLFFVVVFTNWAGTGAEFAEENQRIYIYIYICMATKSFVNVLVSWEVGNIYLEAFLLIKLS